MKRVSITVCFIETIFDLAVERDQEDQDPEIENSEN